MGTLSIVTQSNKVAYVPSKSAKPEIVRASFSFNEVAFGEIISEVMNTGINSNSPAIMLLKSAVVYAGSWGGTSDTNSHSGLKVAIERNENEVLENNAADAAKFNTDIEKALAFGSFGGANNIGPHVLTDFEKPIFEEQIVMTVGHGSEYGSPAVTGTAKAQGMLLVEFYRYKVTQKQWLELATAETTNNRFI